jgi:hypothetical protein
MTAPGAFVGRPEFAQAEEEAESEQQSESHNIVFYIDDPPKGDVTRYLFF